MVRRVEMEKKGKVLLEGGVVVRIVVGMGDGKLK